MPGESVLFAAADHQGANPLEIQRRLGHQDIKTTLGIYGHCFLMSPLTN